MLLPSLRHFRVINILGLLGTTYTAWCVVVKREQVQLVRAAMQLLLSNKNARLQVHHWHGGSAWPLAASSAWAAEPSRFLHWILSHHERVWRPCDGAVSEKRFGKRAFSD